MTYPLYQTVLQYLDSSRGRWPEVADGSGVPVSTIRKIAQRKSLDPGVRTVEALAAYFKISYLVPLGAVSSCVSFESDLVSSDAGQP
ncbi:helix-turn-helix transcriptional regulator [Chromobacterium alkanivorans]|uniref:helix-turn-helix domain-containing protein n=1 Tax=Chromobacterium alkanivorans TaxID=1071719 RepID=UPI0019672656|nr:helix-turn-helix transcriptional regulator [Chromobacterium alkanivorans]MBN3004496.1 helix-turn-helix transcriptional regulator [Chromobacterium alkanivorans]